MTRASWSATLLSLGLAVAGACGGGQHASPGGDDELRARCERFVSKAEALGATEEESTHQQKVDFCVAQRPPDALMDCVERARSKLEAEAC